MIVPFAPGPQGSAQGPQGPLAAGPAQPPPKPVYQLMAAVQMNNEGRLLASDADSGQPATPTMAIDKPQGLLAPGNIDLTKRPQVKNPDGSISTVRSMSVDFGQGEVLIPTVAEDGSRILNNEEAIDQYKQTGKFLGRFDTPDNADAYAEALHKQQSKYYIKTPKK